MDSLCLTRSNLWTVYDYRDRNQQKTAENMPVLDSHQKVGVYDWRDLGLPFGHFFLYSPRHEW